MKKYWPLALLSTLPLLNCSTKTSTPMACEVKLSALNGETIEVHNYDDSDKMPFKTPTIIIWHPAGTTSPLDFVVSYSGTLSNIGAPKAVGFSFPPKGGLIREKYAASLTFDHSDQENIGSEYFSISKDQGDIDLKKTSTLGQNLINATLAGKTIEISITYNGEVLSQGTFWTKDASQRDALFSAATQLVSKKDQKYCKPI